MRKNPKGVQVEVPSQREYKPLRDIRKVSRGSYFRGERTLRDYSQDEFEWYGCVINPKMMRPYFVGGVQDGRYTSGRYVIYVPTTDLTSVEVVGAGYFETGAYSDYGAPARITGYPRIHTPAGVAEKGTGLGNVLYTGGCVVGSHLVVGNSSGKVRTSLDDDVMLQNAGCSSGPGASYSARRWWEGAVSLGLAEQTTGETSEEEEPEWDTVTRDYVTEDRLDLDDWYSHTSRTRYASLDEFFSDGYYEGVYNVNFDHPFDEVENTEPQGFDLELSENDTFVTAQVTFSVKSRDGSEHEGTIEVAAEDIEINDDRFALAVDRALEDAFKEKTEELLVSLAEEFGEIDPDSLKIESIDDVEFSPSGVYVTLTGEVEITGYRGSESEVIECFYYPIENALKARLVLDFNELLTEEYGEDLEGKKALETVLNLDLAEIEDPEIFRFFFGLAEHLGATQSQLRQFKNRVTLRSDLPRDIGEREYLFDPDMGFSPELRKKGYIVNPAEDLDFQAIGRELYGDLVDLD